MEEPPGDVRSITERNGELRELIRSRVTSEVMQKKIKECVEELQVQEKRRRKNHGEEEGEESNNLLRLLEERGLVEDVMAGLKLGGDLGGRSGPTSKGETSRDAKSGQQSLMINFLAYCTMYMVTNYRCIILKIHSIMYIGTLKYNNFNFFCR